MGERGQCVRGHLDAHHLCAQAAKKAGLPAALVVASARSRLDDEATSTSASASLRSLPRDVESATSSGVAGGPTR